MPRELPGLYWDESRNRYFPLSSKPKANHINVPAQNLARPEEESKAFDTALTSSQPSRPSLKRKRSTYANLQRLQGSTRASSYTRNSHEIFSSQIASTSRATCSVALPIPKHDTITSFSTTDIGGRIHRIIGDSNGWLYSFVPEGQEEMTTLQDGTVIPVASHWTPELNLASQISSTCISGNRCIATSFGPASKIYVQDFAQPETIILTPGASFVHDIWTADLQDRRLILGMRKKAVCLLDIDSARGFDSLDTGSDVFALHQHRDLVFAGSRNGSIMRFDLRTRNTSSGDDGTSVHEMFDGIFRADHSSITDLSVLHEWELLVSSIKGHLQLYDLRFPNGSRPLMTFSGHSNTYHPKLGLAVDPSLSFLFAAGEDHMIRAWSLRTGSPLKPSRSPELSSSLTLLHATARLDDHYLNLNPLSHIFKMPVLAMAVSQEREGLALWAASGNKLYQFGLGQWDIC